MLTRAPLEPVHYDPSLEEPEANEEELVRGLIATMRRISEITYRDGGHAIRSVHAKSHGLLHGELELLAPDDALYAQGMFAKSARHPVIMRFSTIPGDLLDDAVSVPRGLAIKIFDVEGERLPGSEGQATQDFLFINSPAFGAPDLKSFLQMLNLLAGTTDKFEWFKKAMSAALQPIEGLLERLGGGSGTLATLGGHPPTNILGETYYSQGALRFDDYVAKISLAPVSSDLVALHHKRVDLRHHPDGLRAAVVEFFKAHSGVWELRAQLCTDVKKMPIENPAVVWPEALSPFVTIARLYVKPQLAWSQARSVVVDDGLAFSPWNGLALHQPLGRIMRARRMAYEAGARFRAEHNHRSIEEPREFASLPD
jgi:hypothetical protein